jgi:hypothetical protein
MRGARPYAAALQQAAQLVKVAGYPAHLEPCRDLTGAIRAYRLICETGDWRIGRRFTTEQANSGNPEKLAAYFIGFVRSNLTVTPRPTPAQPSGGEGTNERAEEYRSAVDDMQAQWDDVTRRG